MKILPFSFSELRLLDRKTVSVLVISALCLTFIEFGASAARILYVWNKFQGTHYFFWSNVYWASVSIVFYLVVPVITIKFFFREPLSNYGLKPTQFFGYYKVYLLSFVLIFPVLIFVSYSPSFQVTYPFYFPDQKDFFPYFIIYEFFYVVQFFALEFFFRGFMVHGLKPKLGLYSVFIMAVPYCMIHFGKPLPECLGSILAGIFLGLMSYRTVSIWMGALLHVAVALSMDALSLWQRHFF